ncbi:MAG: FG-GAP-like repeat-containing protein [Ignavibacteria bacterium]
MKKAYTTKFLIHFFLFLSIAASSKANWNQIEENRITQQTQNANPDSLPAGVTRDWLNKLTDENGKRIIPAEDPDGDAMQQNTFSGVVAGDEYGRSVSNAGDVNGDGFDDVIIGAAHNNAGGINAGRAYIYFGGTVINTAVDVILTGAAVNNYLGASVSSAGDVNSDGYDDVIVGAYGYNSFTGRAYIYFGGASMNSVADVILTGQFTNHEFGKSVSGAGDLNGDSFDDVLVGAFAANGYTGKAYIFYGSAAMDNVADLTMNGEYLSDEFGISVSNAGDVNGDGYADAVVGAGNNSGYGKAYIYFGGITMNNVADVTMYGEGIANYFGNSVSSSGDVNDDGYADVIIGAYGYNSYTGRTYIYYGGASMNSSADVIMTGEATNNLFGYSVSESGDINGDGFADVIVGGYGYSSSKGRSYVYYGGTAMNNVVDLYMTGDTTFNYFGYTVSGGGDVNGDGYADMISGAYGNSSSKGTAYVYTNTMTGTDIPDITMTGEGLNNYFGYSVSGGCDVNGDGYEDVIIGAYYYNSVYIYLGGLYMDNVADVTLTGEGSSSFGLSVSSAGDVNADGYADVIVGARGYSTRTGRAYIYFGGSSMDNTSDVIMTGEGTNNYFGVSVSTAGDVNGDGYADVIVGADFVVAITSKAYIYFGGSSMDNIADVIMNGEETYNEFGYSVSGAGDVNGDGYADVIVGAGQYSSNTGRAYIYFGGSSMNNVSDVIMNGEAANYYFGQSVSGAGDVNGDGYADVIVGANRYSGFPGRAYIYFGGSSMNNIADVIMTREVTGDYFGISVSGAGDVNGDGFADVIIGAVGVYPLNGKAYVYFGEAAMNNTADVIMTGEATNNDFGVSVSTAGDLNGDGYADVIVGDQKFSGFTGKAYIYLSSPPDNRKNLFLFGAIQGFYNPVSNTEIPDTVRVYLRNSTSPYTIVDSSKNILLGPGTGQNFLFRNVQNGIPFYVVVRHRNALETWSASPITFVNSDASVAFSPNSIYAYGNNEIKVDDTPYDVYAFYSGDVNQDGVIDATDNSAIDNDAYNFLTGYVATDLTGDDFVDASDAAIADNNAANFVAIARP